MRTSLLLALLTCVLVPSVAEASTIVVGGNTGNQTWTPAGSPYIVQGDVTVQAGATLTIQAGTQVQFASSDGQASGTDTSRVELIVNGTLVVNGTAGSPVTFAAQSGSSAGLWYGIELNGGATSATIANATIDHAINAITTALPGTTLNLSATVIRTCSTNGVLVTAGSPTISTVNVSACPYGFRVTGGSPTFSNVVANAITSTGFYNASGNPTTTITNGTFAGGGTFGVRSSSGTINISSSIVTGYSYGLYGDVGGLFTATYDDVWNNGTPTTNAALGTGCFSANPLFVSAANPRLTSNSPARFSGSTGQDMGGLPFTTDATVGMVGTLWTDTTIASGTTTIPGDLTVAPGVTLTIMPGATLSFATSDQMAAYTDTSRAELRVLGTLSAQGTTGAPITMTSTGSSAGGWYGLELLASATGSVVDNVLIEETIIGVTHAATAAQTIRRTTSRTCSTDGFNVATSASIDAITVTACAYGVRHVGGTLRLTNAVVYAITSTGFYANASGASATIVNSTFAAGGTFGVRSSSGTIAISNSIVTGFSYGLYGDVGGLFVASYDDVWNNGTPTTNASTGAGSISANPLFVSATDLHLQSSSVCIDVGTATGAPSADRDSIARPLDGDGVGGAAFDIGAYEYRLATVCGDGAVTSGEFCDDGAQNGTYGHCNATCTALGPRCGDAMMNGPEACDDGNTSNTDACLNTCVAASCGDNYTRAGVEQCDDGNAVTTDACVMCMTATCGDTYVRMGVEQCDDGNASSTDACVMCANAFCGDAHVRMGVEACDDGNTSNTDACLNTCVVASCGDGYVGPGEQCDDGNMVNTDACSNVCHNAGCGDGTVQAGEECDDGNMVNDDTCSNACRTPRCGDGIIQSGEQCDDGNMVNTDSCSNVCHTASCGDGIQQASEQCDDGNTNPSDGCTATCRTAVCGDGVVHTGVEQCDDGNASNTDTCVTGCTTAVCGDGFLHTGVEACDDGNHVDTDGCSNTCAAMSCGDGTVQAGEECDDGNTSNTDACLNTCINASCGDGFRRVTGEACDDGNADNTDACTSTCHVASCGDGFVHTGTETCDDGNGSDEDACLSTCTSARCGDHFVESGVETCDDGNSTPGDGCSASCMTEARTDGGVTTDAGTGHDAGVGVDAGTGMDSGISSMGDGGTGMHPDAGGSPMTSTGSCGCRAIGSRGRGEGAMLLSIGLALLVVRRRRRLR